MNKKSEKQASDLRGRAIAAAEAHTKSALVLAEALFEIFYGCVVIGKDEVQLVHAWKFDNFHEYAEHELGMHGSTAHSYVQVHDRLILTAGVEQDKLPKSITKLRQLARVAGSEGQNVKGWLKRANELSCCEFQAAVDEALTGKVAHRNVSFYMKSSQITAIYRHIKRAKEVLGTSTNGETLSEMVSQWSEVQASSAKLRKVAS